MKKYLVTALLILLPTVSFATSGACSDHQGVMCSAGASSSGSVICNDGWVNSSVKYSDALECKDICLVTQDVYDNALKKSDKLTKSMLSEATKYATATQGIIPLTSLAQSQIQDTKNLYGDYISQQENQKTSCASVGRGFGDATYSQGLSQTCLDTIQKRIDGYVVQMNSQIASITYQDNQYYVKGQKSAYDITNKYYTDELNKQRKITDCQVIKIPPIYIPKINTNTLNTKTLNTKNTNLPKDKILVTVKKQTIVSEKSDSIVSLTAPIEPKKPSFIRRTWTSFLNLFR